MVNRFWVIRNHLSRIKADESLSDQTFLIFEAQVDFIDVRYREHTKWRTIVEMERNESCEHGKYGGVCSRLIIETGYKRK